MKIDRIIYKTLSLLTGGLMVLSIGGCVNDNSECIEDQPGYKEGNDVWLSFHVKNMSEISKTRADKPTDPTHPDEEASTDENTINPKDIALMFFDDRQILWKSFRLDEYIIEEITGSNGSEYTLKFKMNKDYFSYAKGKTDVDYSLMVVANINGLKGESAVFDDNLFAYSPQRIASLYKSFTMPDQSDRAWMPSRVNGDLIPMAGITKGSFSSSVLEKGNTWETAAEIGDVYMQRSLAKIRVLDAFRLKADSNGDYITDVKLVGSNTSGAYIPATDDDWYVGTKVVETATENINANWFSNDSEVIFTYSDSDFKSVVDDGITYQGQFYCYVPEVMVDNIYRDIKIEVKLNSGEIKSFLLKTPTDEYEGIQQIARNHIYEYVIDINLQSQLTVNYTVCPWVSYEIDIPTFE